MARINDHYQKLAAGYLFPEIGRRVAAFAEREPRAEIIRLGIGDVVLPLAKSVRDAMKGAIDEMGTEEGFRGYPPMEGYDFLIDAIVEGDYKSRGITVERDEVFVSDGSKCDSANIQEIFALDATLAVPDPVYPVYVDTNVMAGRTGLPDDQGRYAGIEYLPCTEANGFLPAPPSKPTDLVYLCFPNNPTGTVASRDVLAEWVAWARKHGAVLLYDAAYEAYITESSVPRSIYEVDGARECAIEFRSFSKGAGFTGVRCGYIVVPKELEGRNAKDESVPLHTLWSRRHGTKFNGVSYPVQVGAAATYSAAGKAELAEKVAYYLKNAELIRKALEGAGMTVYGAVNAPYAWVKTPDGLGSWEFFDRLLERAHVVGTPGAGFGACGEGFFRLSAFGKRDQVETALERIQKQL